MTVAEMIEQLQTMDPKAVVVRPWPHGHGWLSVQLVESSEDKYRPALRGTLRWVLASPRCRLKSQVKIVSVT